MAKAKTPFFYERKDGSIGYVNAGEDVPAGVDAGDNVRPEEKKKSAPRRGGEKSE